MTPPNTLGSDPLALVAIAEKILTTIEQHFDAANVILPDRRYIAPGAAVNIAHDFEENDAQTCGQLAITMEGIGWGVSSTSTTGLNVKPGAQASVEGVRHAVFAIQLVRCTPSANPNSRHATVPSAADIHAAGTDFLVDCGLLSQALLVLMAELRNDFLPNRAGLVQGGLVSPVGPAGGVHAAQAQIELTVGV